MNDFAGESVYFFCNPLGPPDAADYQHAVVSFAEGLRDLGVDAFANVDYWRVSPNSDEYLLRHDPQVLPTDCSIVVVSKHFLARNGLPDWILQDREFTTVLLDLRREDVDGSPFSDSWQAFDVVFKSHYNHYRKYPDNFAPTCFGFCNRVLHELSQPERSWDRRNPAVLQNFRQNHMLRDHVKAKLNPLLARVLAIDDRTEPLAESPRGPYARLMWHQSGRRHHPAYFARLRTSAACSAFGGEVLHVNLQPVEREVLERAPTGEQLIVVNWDSWRWWESMLAGCATFHVDFAKYGIRLPVMPENWRHYIGLDLFDLEEAIDRISQQPSLLADIGRAGQLWVLQHYTPKHAATRLLNEIAARRAHSPRTSTARYRFNE